MTGMLPGIRKQAMLKIILVSQILLDNPCLKMVLDIQSPNAVFFYSDIKKCILGDIQHVLKNFNILPLLLHNTI